MDPFDRELLAHFEANKLPGWERMQYKAFRAWVNHKLAVRKWKPAEYLEDTFEDGFTLITLLEILSGKDVVPAGQKTTKNPSFRIQKIGNNNFSFAFMKAERIRLENMHSEDIVDKNRKLILGLIWTLILHYQLAFAKGGDQGPKKELLELVRGLLKPYNLPVDNFDNSATTQFVFQDNAKENLEKAFAILEKKKEIPRMLDPNDVISQKPDEKAVITYLAMILPVLTPLDKMPSNSMLVSNPAEIVPFEAGKQEPSFAIRSCHAGSGLFEAELVGPDGSLPVVVRDNGDKTYAIIPQRPYSTPGVYTLSAYFKRQHISKSPIRFTVLGGGPVRESDAGALFLPSKAGPAAASTLVIFPLTDTFRVPEANPRFVIEPRNANNQPIRTGGHKSQFTASLTGPETMPLEIVDRPDGSYGISVLKPYTMPGRYKLSALCNGADISGSPFFFNIILSAGPLGPSAAHSDLRASPVADSYIAPKDVPQFFVNLRDPSSSPVLNHPHVLTANITGPENIPCSVSEASGGRYNVVLGKPITQPGRYKLSVQCNGTDVNNSPLYFNVTVPVAATPSAANSDLKALPEADSYVAPKDVPQFVVNLRDTNRDSVTNKAHILNAYITGPESIPCTISESTGGRYNVVLGKPIALPGRYKLSVQCNGVDVSNSPLYFNITVPAPSGPSASHSDLKASPQADSYTAPKDIPQFFVNVRDASSAPVRDTPQALAAYVTGPDSIPCTVSDGGNGRYNVVLGRPISTPGRYKLSVLCNGTDVNNSPLYFNITIAKPAPSASHSELKATPNADTYTAPSGLPKFIVLLRDGQRNPCPREVNVLVASLTGPESVPCTMAEAGNGQYEIVLGKPVSRAGKYKLEVLCNGEPVGNTPFYFVIVLLPSAYTSELTPLSIADSYTVPTQNPQLRDMNGDAVANKNEPLSAHLTGPDTIAVAVLGKDSLGQHSINFAKPFTVAGRYQLDVYLGKALVKGSPAFFNVVLRPTTSNDSVDTSLALKSRSPPPTSSLEDLDELYVSLQSKTPELARKKEQDRKDEEARAAADADARIAARRAEDARKADAKVKAEEEERVRTRAALQIEEQQRARARAEAEEADRARARAVLEDGEKTRVRAEEDNRQRQRATAEDVERKRRAVELETTSRSPAPDELESLIGDLVNSNKMAAPVSPKPEANVYTINVKFQSFQPQDASRALDDPLVYSVLIEHQPIVTSLKEQLLRLPVASSGRPADVSTIRRYVSEVEEEENPLKNILIVVFRTRTLDVPALLRMLVSVVRAVKAVIDNASSNQRAAGVRATQVFVLSVLRFIVVVSNLRYATESEFNSAVRPISNEVNDSYRELLAWLRQLYSSNGVSSPAPPKSPQLPVTESLTFRQSFELVLDNLPSGHQALITYNWREVDDIFRLVAAILRSLHPRLPPNEQTRLKATIQPVLDIGKAMRVHQATGNWPAFRDDKARFTLAIHALRDYLIDLERRYNLTIDIIIQGGGNGSGSSRSNPVTPSTSSTSYTSSPRTFASPREDTRSVVKIDIGEVRRTLSQVIGELNAAADSTADNADRIMLREAARSLVGADEPVADAMMFNDIPRLRIAIATYEGKLEAMQQMMRAFEQREAVRRDRARVRCAVCQGVIEGQYLKVGEKGFHKDCFKCTDCRGPIGELFYSDSLGRYYCPNHPPAL